jgi:hypothetical protein
LGESGVKRDRPPNWAHIDQYLAIECKLSLDQAWELTLPEVAVYLSKLHATHAEPEWFIKAWKKAKNSRERLEAVRRMME